MKKKVFALICARGNSKGLKNKNLREFNKNVSLLENSINLSKKSKYISKIYVSSDSNKIISLAKKAGAIIPFKRPKKLASDNAYEIDVWKHFINFLIKNNNLPDYIISVPTTSPLRNIHDIDSAIKKIIKNKYDIVFSLTNTNKNPYFNLVEFKNNKIVLSKKNKKKIKNRQNAPRVMAITTVAYVFDPKYILKSKNLYSGKVGYIEIPKQRAIDIDDELDLIIAKKLIRYAKNSI